MYAQFLWTFLILATFGICLAGSRNAKNWYFIAFSWFGAFMLAGYGWHELGDFALAWSGSPKPIEARFEVLATMGIAYWKAITGGWINVR